MNTGDGRQRPVAICSIAKDEAPFIREWAAYHHLLGFDPILVMDHESTDATPEILAELQQQNLVSAIIGWRHDRGTRPQFQAYDEGWRHLKPLAEWIAFIDIDEFIVLPQHSSIHAFLADFAALDAIAVNWKIMGSSGLTEPTEGSALDRFRRCSLRCFHMNRYVKPIARVDAIARPLVHHCEWRPGISYRTVLGEELAADARMSRIVTHDIIRINHYYTRSAGDWTAKVRRGRAGKRNPTLHRRTTEQFERADRNEAIEHDIIKHLPAVQALLNPA
jgi:hypothetical protein